MAKILFLVAFCIVGVSVFYYMGKPKETPLPIYNPNDLDPDVVDPELLRVGINHKVGKFSFQNQDGKFISDQDVKGKIYVVEYFFTTCGTICPIMNKQMQRVQEAHASTKDFRILSFTVNPEVDDVKQMKSYADAASCKWKSMVVLNWRKSKIV